MELLDIGSTTSGEKMFETVSHSLIVYPDAPIAHSYSEEPLLDGCPTLYWAGRPFQR